MSIITTPSTISRRVAAFALLVLALVLTALAPAAHAKPTTVPGNPGIKKFFPSAVIKATPAAVLPGQPVTVDVSGSTGGFYAIKKYEWDLDGNGSYETTTFTTTSLTTQFAVVGTRTLHLRITNTNNQTATGQTDVVVHNAPKAAFTSTPKPAIAGFPVKLDATDSSDDNGRLGTYGWDLDGDGGYETFTGSPNTTKTFATAGIYTVGLRVTDKYGATDTIVKQIEVLADTTAPVVGITPGSVKLVGRTVSLVVSCPATELRCTGPLSLRIASAKLAKATKFAPAQIAVTGGDSATVNIRVNARAAKLIKRLRKVSTIATATVKDAAGNTGVTNARVIVKR